MRAGKEERGNAGGGGNLILDAKLETDVALVAMQADATSENASFVGACIDVSVQTLGQPSPALTHCELWVAERRTTDDNHFGTYLGQRDDATGELTGAMWTSGLRSSRLWYQKDTWVAIPVFAVNAEASVRAECDQSRGTPYPSPWTLFDYPWSVWPLRSLGGLFLSDGPHASAHCAALSARVLRHALPELPLRHNSHWYGPSSLYLELSTPHQMKRALHLQRPPGVARSIVEEQEEDELLRVLLEESDEAVAAMTPAESRQAVTIAAIKVLQAGAGDSADDVDQTLFLKAQKNYARAMFRHTWVGRVGRHQAELADETEAAVAAAEAEEERKEAAAEAAAARAREAAEAAQANKAAEAAAAVEADEDAAAEAAAIAEATARFSAGA